MSDIQQDGVEPSVGSLPSDPQNQQNPQNAQNTGAGETTRSQTDGVNLGGSPSGIQPESQSGTQPGEPQSGAAAQPQYGQYRIPEYGAMSGQFAPGYDPYVYGRPESAPSGADADRGGAADAGGSGDAWDGARMAPAAGGSRGAMPGADASANSANNANRAKPRYFRGIDLNDPNQNPVYGHWDFYAIAAFILALFFPVPLLTTLLSALAMWRTRVFHTKGFGLAVAALIISIANAALMMWMTANGMTVDDLYRMLLQTMIGTDGNTGGTSGGGISV